MKKIDFTEEPETVEPTFGDRFHPFWMEGKKYDPEVADRMTGTPAVIGGIAFLFGLMILFGLMFE